MWRQCMFRGIRAQEYGGTPADTADNAASARTAKGPTYASTIDDGTSAGSVEGPASASMVEYAARAKSAKEAASASTIGGGTSARIVEGPASASTSEYVDSAGSAKEAVSASMIDGGTNASSVDGGSSICGHGRLRARCKECNGGRISTKRRRDHNVTSLCEHGRMRNQCSKGCQASENEESISAFMRLPLRRPPANRENHPKPACTSASLLTWGP